MNLQVRSANRIVERKEKQIKDLEAKIHKGKIQLQVLEEILKEIDNDQAVRLVGEQEGKV